jgi:hypothetical protein
MEQLPRDSRADGMPRIPNDKLVAVAIWGRSQHSEPTYRDFVRQGLNVNILDDVKAGVLLGSDSSVHSLRPLLRDIEGNREFRREERLATRPTLDELLADVSDMATRNERIHVVVRMHQYRLQEVGDYLGLCYSTISGIAKRIAESMKP